MKKTLLTTALAAFLALSAGFAALTVMPTDAVACHPDCDDDEDDDDSRGSHG